MADKVSGNPKVFEEARERKRGGRIENLKKHKKGEHKPEGEMAKHRADRPRRMSGGRCGSDKNPFSSAHKGS